MEPVFHQDLTVSDIHVDCFGRMKLSMVLYLAQEIAGSHCQLLNADYDTLKKHRLFWAISRHKVQISRLPRSGETIHLETWPMPTTRVAYPRSMVAYDAQGNELFRSISLWVLMDLDSRKMVLPGQSPIAVEGTLRGMELASPAGLVPKPLANCHSRTVCYSDLDRNGHMNNTKYLDWIGDLLPSSFHAEHSPREMTLCYTNEAREGQTLSCRWEFLEEGTLQVEGSRSAGDRDERVFSAKLLFD